MYLIHALFKTVHLLLLGVSRFTESMSHTDVDRLRRQVIDPQKEDLKSIPVASDRPMEEQIMNVNVSLYIRKLIDVVETNLFLHYITCL